jgi:hypothetical protein
VADHAWPGPLITSDRRRADQLPDSLFDGEPQEVLCFAFSPGPRTMTPRRFKQRLLRRLKWDAIMESTTDAARLDPNPPIVEDNFRSSISERDMVIFTDPDDLADPECSPDCLDCQK